MVLSWLGGGRPESVEDLIARRKYGRAIELLRQQFKQGSRDPRLRMQLADVLALAGKGREAVPILVGLADEHAREGFAAKAIALLKKIERLEPGRKDVEQRLAFLIHQEKKRAAPVPVPAPAPAEAPEIGLELEAAPAPRPDPAPAPRAETETAPPPAEEAPLELEPLGGEPEMSEEDFGLVLVEVAHEVGEAQPPSGAAPAATPVAASPLFGDFSESELLAIMQGMQLIAFEAGDIIVTEGEPGDSLFVLTTGVVKAFIRNPAGRHVLVREMGEGSFFGEISILTGKPRTATVTAATRCELLELDRAALERITASHRNVLSVLQEFHAQRAGSKDEELIRRMSFGSAKA